MRFLLIMLTFGVVAACAAPGPDSLAPTISPAPPPTQPVATEHAPSPLGPTPLPTRARWQYGELLPYTAQPGDTLYTIAIHFNTTTDAIRQANPNFEPNDTTLLPPGQPLVIPANYASLIGTPYHIIPDSELVYSPGQNRFVLKATVLENRGFLSRYSEYAEEKTRPSWEIIERVARDYSINPRLLLTLIEYRSGALTQPGVADFT